jgi:hypothetical protein
MATTTTTIALLGELILCDKCQPKREYWLHIADRWTLSEMLEIRDYLREKIHEKAVKAVAVWEKMSEEEKRKLMLDILDFS